MPLANHDYGLISRFLLNLDIFKNMPLILNKVKYICNSSKSKLDFPLSNAIYCGVIASLVGKLSRVKPEYVFWDTR